MKKFFLKLVKTSQMQRRGMTLVETLVSLVIFSLGVIVMARITSAKVQEQANLDSQYELISMDAMMSDIYHDFHACESIAVNSSGSGDTQVVNLTFDLGDGIVHIYDWFAADSTFYFNGVEQFKCYGMEASYLSGNLTVALFTESDKRLEMDIYK